MSSDHDIEMNVDDTLEIDTIIKNSSDATKNMGITSNNNSNYNINGIQTHTGIFDPEEADVYTINVNGKKLKINVVGGIPQPDSGLARWTFDYKDTTDTQAKDVWNSNDGTIDNVTTGSMGSNQNYNTNESYSFDGSSSVIKGIDMDIKSIGLPLTFSAWIKLNNASQFGDIFSNRDGSSGTDGMQFMVKGGDVRFRFAGGNPNLFAGVSLSTDTWYFVTGVANTDSTVLYVDGVEENRSSQSANLNSSLNLMIGAEDYEGVLYFDGQIDDPRIYTKALTTKQVSNLYNTGKIK